MVLFIKLDKVMVAVTCVAAFSFTWTSVIAQETNCSGWPVPSACSKADSFAVKAEVELNWNNKHRSLLAAAVNYKICGDENRAATFQSQASRLLKANTEEGAPQTDNLMIQMMADNLIEYGHACERSAKRGGE